MSWQASRSALGISGLLNGRGTLRTRPQYCASGASVSTKAGGILPSGSCLPGGLGRLGACAGPCWLSCCVLGRESNGLAAGRAPKRASAAACRGHQFYCQHLSSQARAMDRPKRTTGKRCRPQHAHASKSDRVIPVHMPRLPLQVGSIVFECPAVLAHLDVLRCFIQCIPQQLQADAAAPAPQPDMLSGEHLHMHMHVHSTEQTKCLLCLCTC